MKTENICYKMDIANELYRCVGGADPAFEVRGGANGSENLKPGVGGGGGRYYINISYV